MSGTTPMANPGSVLLNVFDSFATTWVGATPAPAEISPPEYPIQEVVPLWTEGPIGGPSLSPQRFAPTSPAKAAAGTTTGGTPLGIDSAERPFIRDFIDGIERHAMDASHRWLGLIAPMQTGKSHSIGPMITRMGSKFDRVIVLTASDIATKQIHADLTAQNRADTIGRYDASHKDLQRITVASIWTLIHYLGKLPSEAPTLVILDEAYHLQCKTLRRILTRLGVAQSDPANSRKIIPAATPSLLVALSGTAAGLDPHCRVAGRLEMLDAIAGDWIRKTSGLRVFPKEVAAEKKRVKNHQEIWWQATAENAWRLACEYKNHIAGKYRKNLVFAPTIEHAIWLHVALQQICADEKFSVLHSHQSRTDQDAAYANFENGGTLISVRKITRSYRAEGSGAVFHTFQSSSMEYFAQTTGRGWGQDTDKARPALFVLEACWDHRPIFSNLARLFGLTDYPKNNRIDAATLIQRTYRQLELDMLRQDVRAEIMAGHAHRLFANVPLARAWRIAFRQFIDAMAPYFAQDGELPDRENLLERLANLSGLDARFSSAYAQGALPIRITHVHLLGHFLNQEISGRFLDRQASQRLALALLLAAQVGWASAVEDMRTRVRGTDAVATRLIRWHDDAYAPWHAAFAGGDHDIAHLLQSTQALEAVLQANFKLPRNHYVPSDADRAAIARLAPHIALLQQLWDIYQDKRGTRTATDKASLIIRRGDTNLPLSLSKRLRQAVERGAFRFQSEWFEAAQFFMGFLMMTAYGDPDPVQRQQALLRVEDLERTIFELRGWPRTATTTPETLRLLARRAHIRLYTQALHIPKRWGRFKYWGTDREISDFIAGNPQQEITPQLTRRINRYLDELADPGLGVNMI